MMTPEAICDSYGIDLVYFDGRGTESKAMFNKKHNIIAIDAYLDDAEKAKRIYHELGHRDHTPEYYARNREYCEAQANRNMIHHLLIDELKHYDNIEDFNYVHFMEKYQLNTITNETIIKEEFLNLLDLY